VVLAVCGAHLGSDSNAFHDLLLGHALFGDERIVGCVVKEALHEWSSICAGGRSRVCVRFEGQVTGLCAETRQRSQHPMPR